MICILMDMVRAWLLTKLIHGNSRLMQTIVLHGVGLNLNRLGSIITQLLLPISGWDSKRLLLITANRLAIQNRVLILLLFEAIDVGQQRIDKILLLLLII